MVFDIFKDSCFNKEPIAINPSTPTHEFRSFSFALLNKTQDIIQLFLRNKGTINNFCFKGISNLLRLSKFDSFIDKLIINTFMDINSWPRYATLPAI